MSEDRVISPTNTFPQTAKISNKPNYLLKVDVFDKKTKTIKNFVTLDKPEFLNNFVFVRGFFTDWGEDEVILNLSKLLTETSKDLYIEAYFQSTLIHKIQSLVYRAK